MCEPSVIAGGAQAAGGIIQRYEQGERYKEALNASTIQARTNQATVNTRISQERVSTAYRANALGLEADKVRGQVAVSAAAGGVQGTSIQELESEVTMRETENAMALSTSLGWTEDQLEAEKVAIGQRAAAQAAQYMPTSTYLGAVLGGAGTGGSLLLQGQTADIKRST